MKTIKRDLPMYVLSAALVFLGVAISTNNAGAAANPSAQISALQQNLNQFKQCANSNFNELSYFSVSGNNRTMFIRTCR